MNNKDVEAQKNADMEAFEKSIAELGKQFPDHKIKEFTFTNVEQQLLAEQITIKSLAQQSIDNVINEVTLKRVGIIPNPNIQLRYSVGLGRFVLFIPKK